LIEAGLRETAGFFVFRFVWVEQPSAVASL
jgi:hypothetical protein